MDCELKHCNICFDIVHEINISITNCKHLFHTNCLLKWIIINNTCPLCRYELYSDIKQELSSEPYRDPLDIILDN